MLRAEVPGVVLGSAPGSEDAYGLAGAQRIQFCIGIRLARPPRTHVAHVQEAIGFRTTNCKPKVARRSCPLNSFEAFGLEILEMQLTFIEIQAQFSARVFQNKRSAPRCEPCLRECHAGSWPQAPVALETAPDASSAGRGLSRGA